MEHLDIYKGRRWFYFLSSMTIIIFSLVILVFIIFLSWLLINNNYLTLFMIGGIPIIVLTLTFLFYSFRNIFFLSPYTIEFKECCIEFKCILKSYIYNKNSIKIYNGIGRGKVYNIKAESDEKNVIFKIGTIGYGKRLDELVRRFKEFNI